MATPENIIFWSQQVLWKAQEVKRLSSDAAQIADADNAARVGVQYVKQAPLLAVGPMGQGDATLAWLKSQSERLDAELAVLDAAHKKQSDETWKGIKSTITAKVVIGVVGIGLLFWLLARRK
jgi:hypothetical protein